MLYSKPRKILSIGLIFTLILPNLSLAGDNTAAVFTLSPPLASKPPCEIISTFDGSWDIVTPEDAVENIDEKIIQTKEIPGKVFRDKWSFVELGSLIAKRLDLQISKYTLEDEIRKHLRERGGLEEMFQEGYDLEKIEEVRENGKIVAFMLYISLDDDPAYKFTYSLTGDENADLIIPRKNKPAVYVKSEPDEKDPLPDELIPITPVNLWEDPKVKAVEEILEIGGVKGFKRLPRVKKNVPAEIMNTPRYTEVRKHKKYPKVQLIKKYIRSFEYNNVETFLEKKSIERNPWITPMFTLKDDSCNVYELNLLSDSDLFGYETLGTKAQPFFFGYDQKINASIAQALQDNFTRFIYGPEKHHHRANIMIKRKNGNLIDLKIIDLKFIENRMKSNAYPYPDFFDYINKKRPHLKGAFLKYIFLYGMGLPKVNLRNADLGSAKLWSVYLANANLREADLGNAQLYDTILIYANLKKADLTSAILTRVQLMNSDLMDADLRKAELSLVDFSNANLSEADLRHIRLKDNGETMRTIENAVLKNTKFDMEHAGSFKEKGFHVVEIPEENYCFVTSKEELLKDAKIQSTLFEDTVKLLQPQKLKDPLIVALGTSWIKEHMEGPHSDALNQLITSMRNFCKENGIIFVDRDNDDDLLTGINEAREHHKNSKVIILAGENTVTSGKFTKLRKDQNAFLAGVNNEHMTPDNHVRLMEMLKLTMRLACRKYFDVNPDNPYIDIEEKSGYYLLTPKAEPLDYELLKDVCDIQIFA